MKKTGKLALGGVFTALAVVLLLLTVSPVATIGTVALAALCGIPVVVELGRKAGLLHFVAVALLAWLIVPGMEGKLFYTLFFGWYTIVKAWIEQKHLSPIKEWGVKIALFLVALGGNAIAYAFLISSTSPKWDTETIVTVIVAYVLLTGLFLVYDRCLTGLVGVYMTRLRPMVRRAFHLN